MTREKVQLIRVIPNQMRFSFRPWQCNEKDCQGYTGFYFLPFALLETADEISMNILVFSVSLSKFRWSPDTTVCEEEDRSLLLWLTINQRWINNHGRDGLYLECFSRLPRKRPLVSRNSKWVPTWVL